MGEDRSREQTAPGTRRPGYGLSMDYVEPFEPEPATGFRRVCGMALTVVGMLTLALSGACAIVFLAQPGPSVPLYVPLLLSGPFVLLGLLLWWGGDRMKWRQPKKRRLTNLS